MIQALAAHETPSKRQLNTTGCLLGVKGIRHAMPTASSLIFGYWALGSVDTWYLVLTDTWFVHRRYLDSGCLLGVWWVGGAASETRFPSLPHRHEVFERQQSHQH